MTVPSSWSTLPLGDVVTDILDFRGRTPKKLGMNWGDGDIPALSAINVRLDSIDLSRTVHWGSETLYARWMTQGDPQQGDVVITTEAPMGNVAQLPDNGKYILSQRVILLKPRRDLLDPAFLAAQMRGQEFQSKLIEHQSGTTATGIRQSRLVALPVHVPPLNEQRRIVAKLDAIFEQTRAAKARLERLPALLDKLKRSILAAAFRGDLTADWRAAHHDVEPASLLLNRISAERRARWETALRAKGKTPARATYDEPFALDSSSLFSIPDSWSWTSIDALQDFDEPLCYGVVQPGDEDPAGVQLIRVCDLDSGNVLVDQLRTIASEVDAQYARSRVRGGELLVSVVGTIGRTAVVPPLGRPANIARALARIVPTKPVDTRWLLHWISSTFMEFALGIGAREVARATLNIEVLRQQPVPVAPPAEMSVIIERVSQAFASLESVAHRVEVARERVDQLERGALAKTFRGELVEQDPNDEPSASLLDQIHAAERSINGAKPSRATKTTRAKARAAAAESES